MGSSSKFAANKLRSALLPAIFCSALIAGCGGGSNGDTPSTPPAPRSLLSGTAAGGAPIVGLITIKDSKGIEKTVQVNGDGRYLVDADGMTPPFLLKASGMVGGRSVTLLSAATASDVNNTVNINPLTDLVIANVTARTAEEFYDNPDFSLLTETELNAAKNMLQQRLRVVLSDLNVPADIDLLRTPFAADHRGLDAVLDMLKVEIRTDPNINSKKAIITNIADPAKPFIEDDLTSKSDNSQLSTSIELSVTAANVQTIQAQFDTLSSQLAVSTPDPTHPNLKGLFDASFLHNGEELDAFLAELTATPGIIGVKFGNVAIEKYFGANIIKVKCRGTYQDGKPYAFETFMTKDPVTLKWLIAGNQELIETGVFALTEKSPAGIKTGLTLFADGGNINSHIDYVIVKGGGLPADGVTLVRQNGMFVVEGTTSNLIAACSSTLTLGCVDIAALPANTEYTFDLWNDKNTPATPGDDTLTSVSTVTLPKAPYSLDYATANASTLFPALVPGNTSLVIEDVYRRKIAVSANSN
ncbi:MAG: hypothetical protein IDH49_03955 [Gammaproteobacteria bacterium]|nr:hypothetical protein [Gammaproteobacteria bacterium]